MKEKLNTIVLKTEGIFFERGFSKKGETYFVRKNKKDFGRIEQFSFSARAHRTDPKSIYVSCAIGLYYPEVRKKEQIFIDDFIFKYPIVTGSVSHFSESNVFLSVLYTPGQNDDAVVLEIKKEIENGGFHLISVFPDLESILAGIFGKHPYLTDYHKVYNERSYVTVTTIILLLQGQQAALNWVESNYHEGAYKVNITNKLLKI